MAISLGFHIHFLRVLDSHLLNLSLFEYIRQELKTKNKPIHNSIKDFNQCLICIDEFQYFLEENKENNFDNIYIKELIPLLNNSNCCVILTGNKYLIIFFVCAKNQ